MEEGEAIMTPWEEVEVNNAFLAQMAPYLNGSDTSSSKDVALRVDKMIDEYIVDDPECHELEGALSAFWFTAFGKASTIPYDNPAQDRLLEILLELKKLPSEKTFAWGKAVYYYWNGSLEESIASRDTWDETRIAKGDITDETPDKIHEDYENINAFLARMMRPGSELEMGFFTFVIHGFQEPSPMISAVRAAALWFKIAGQHLYDRTFIENYWIDNGVLKKPKNIGPQGMYESEYDCKLGWCLERWTWCKERLKSLAGNYDEVTKGLMLEAVKRMEEIEAVDRPEQVDEAS